MILLAETGEAVTGSFVGERFLAVRVELPVAFGPAHPLDGLADLPAILGFLDGQLVGAYQQLERTAVRRPVEVPRVHQHVAKCGVPVDDDALRNEHVLVPIQLAVELPGHSHHLSAEMRMRPMPMVGLWSASISST